MRKLAWGDELCGETVTPESWRGGIVARRNEWEVARYVNRKANNWPGGINGCAPSVHTPIFPPRGWAGKTDAELWAEIMQPWEGEIASINTRKGCISLCVDDSGNLDIDVTGGATRLCASSPDQLLALILALQNARVLAARLKEEPCAQD